MKNKLKLYLVTFTITKKIDQEGPYDTSVFWVARNKKEIEKRFNTSGIKNVEAFNIAKEIPAGYDLILKKKKEKNWFK